VGVSTVEAPRGLGLAVVGGVGFGAFGARGFIGAVGRVVAELIALGALEGGGFRGLRWLALMVLAEQR
jgi:hypothetical protein